MATKELLDMMNTGISNEMQVCIQYMWQHVLWSGVKAYAVNEQIRKIAMDEMKHAELIAERLNYLGGIPTTKPTTIVVGNKLKDMLAQDKKDEEGAITLYKKIIEKAMKEGDPTTAHLFREILEDEEEHHDFFSTALEEV